MDFKHASGSKSSPSCPSYINLNIQHTSLFVKRNCQVAVPLAQ